MSQACQRESAFGGFYLALELETLVPELEPAIPGLASNPTTTLTFEDLPLRILRVNLPGLTGFPPRATFPPSHSDGNKQSSDPGKLAPDAERWTFTVSSLTRCNPADYYVDFCAIYLPVHIRSSKITNLTVVLFVHCSVLAATHHPSDQLRIPWTFLVLSECRM